MNFSLKSNVRKTAVRQLFESNEEVVPRTEENSSKPIDYLKLREEMTKQQQQRESAVGGQSEDLVETIDDARKEREALLRRRDEAMLGKKEESSRSTESAPVNLQQAGLVVLGQVQRSESRHISRMVETAQVNAKFKNLMKMKRADREKDKCEAEFGERPEEIVTKAYLKQKEESLRLEKELEASESKKRDMTNMFREMLESGSYARSKYVDAKSEGVETMSLLARITEPVQREGDVKVQLVEKVLEKIVTQETKEAVKAVEQQAKLDALKIIQQIDMLEGGEDELDREEARMSAKERYLQRKKLKLLEEE